MYVGVEPERRRSDEFELSRNVDEAANDVRDRVSRIRGSLPREAEDPVIQKCVIVSGTGFRIDS